MLRKAVHSLLSERIGLDSHLAPANILDRVIRERMKACGLGDEAAYLRLLTSSEGEQADLIDSIVVPETWFFRDFEPFAVLGRFVVEEGFVTGKGAPLTILSIPASTGEEAYSIAMTLLEAGLRPESFTIHGVDISKRAVQKAVRAVYGPSSFREKEGGPRSRYFRETEAGFELDARVRDRVRFMQGNVLDHAALAPGKAYDVVFFRNLLIYLHEQARRKAIRNIDSLLKESGLLFLGYAEPQRVFFPDYVPVKHPRGYAARKPGSASARIRTQEHPGPGVSKTVVRQEHPVGNCAAPVKSHTMTRKKPVESCFKRRGDEVAAVENAGAFNPSGQDLRGLLDRACELADRGMLAEAQTLCADCLKSDLACVEAHYLLGVIALARKDEEQALKHFNKVTYLDPNHMDALVHLSLLMERKGLQDQAARYRERMKARSGKLETRNG